MKRNLIRAEHTSGKVLFFNSVESAAEKLSTDYNTIIAALNASDDSQGEIKKYVEPLKRVNGYRLTKTASSRRIFQYDLNGNLVSEYNSVKDAIDNTGISRLHKVLQDRMPKYGNYYWVYADANILTDSRTIIAITESGETIGKYFSIKEAADDTCIDAMQIFSSLLSYNSKGGLYFLDFENNSQQYVELDAKDKKLIRIFSKLYDVCLHTGLSRTQLCYASKSEREIDGRIYMKLEKYLMYKALCML